MIDVAPGHGERIRSKTMGRQVLNLLDGLSFGPKLFWLRSVRFLFWVAGLFSWWVQSQRMDALLCLVAAGVLQIIILQNTIAETPCNRDTPCND